MSTTIIYKSHTLDLATLPSVSVLALASRGLVRLMGSEVSSKVISHFKDTPDADDAAREAFAESCRTDLVAQLVAGTLGEGRSGPRKDPVEAEIERLAKIEVKETLKTHGLKFAKPAPDANGVVGDAVVTFGNGATKTLAAMVETRIAGHGDRLRKTAEKSLADAARMAKKAAEAIPANAVVDPEALGL